MIKTVKKQADSVYLAFCPDLDEIVSHVAV